MKKPMLAALLALGLFGLYQFRVYRVAAMETEAHLEDNAIRLAQSQAIEAAFPDARKSCGGAYDGAVAALARAGAINHRNRMMIETLKGH